MPVKKSVKRAKEKPELRIDSIRSLVEKVEATLSEYPPIQSEMIRLKLAQNSKLLGKIESSARSISAELIMLKKREARVRGELYDPEYSMSKWQIDLEFSRNPEIQALNFKLHDTTETLGSLDSLRWALKHMNDGLIALLKKEV